MTTERFAVYFAPSPDGPWWDAGSEWLGRCAERAIALPQPAIPGLAAEAQRHWTRAPRRYGWHATLKAPFTLAEGVDLDALLGATQAIARRFEPFELPPLRVKRLDDFLALVPDDQTEAAAVADACVQTLQPLAAPLSGAELARRRAAGLTPQEDALLLRWGYPFVGARFRFHLSLSGSLREAAAAEIDALHAAAAERFESLPPCRFDSIALFAEPAPGADFELVERLALGR
jgi:putative phosphonate metabolism protein